jgi:hypothetical protein
MKIATEQLIKDLTQRTESIISRIELLKQLPLEKLNFKASITSWSVLECIEHLNMYADYYNPEMKKSIENSSTKPAEMYKGGILGRYFTNSMLPKEKLNKMKTFDDKNPIGSQLGLDVVEKFITQQKELIELMDLSKKINISKTRTAISISKIIRLKLGDTFRFNVAHNERHLLQAEKATS